MKVETSRFGTLEITEEDLIVFPEGLLGFHRYKQFVLVQVAETSPLLWLQSVRVPELAFVIADPRLFRPDYQVQVKKEDLKTIELTEVEKAEVYVILNRVDGELTANLQGPLVINPDGRLGKQLVLSDKRFPVRYPLGISRTGQLKEKTA